jgi:cellulose synthase/poly-beta-1,6-N-acetylglucosamine synthase-like glycosyltransferase
MNNPFAASELEIIYVDSNSSDNSRETAEKLGARVLLVTPERPAAAVGRNAGWQAAQFPFVLFLDGDTILHPDFVKTAWEVLRTEADVAVVFGHRREMYPNTSIYQRALDLDWLYPLGDVVFCGGDALMRREVLHQVDGYNPNLIAGEEPEMCQRIRAAGYRVRHIDHPMTLHDLAITQFWQYWWRSMRTGHAYAEVSNLLQDSKQPLWQADAQRNWRNFIVWMGLFLMALMGSLMGMTLWSWFIFMGLFLSMSLRTAWKNRWRTPDKVTLFWYGIHSQFQHIPIAVGQINYYWQSFKGKRQKLFEYKK